MIFKSGLTRPHCGHAKQEPMPTEACQFFYECEHCHPFAAPAAGRLLRVLSR